MGRSAKPTLFRVVGFVRRPLFGRGKPELETRLSCKGERMS